MCVCLSLTSVLQQVSWKGCEVNWNLEGTTGLSITTIPFINDEYREMLHHSVSRGETVFSLTFVFILLQWSVWRCGNMTGWFFGQNVMLVSETKGLFTVSSLSQARTRSHLDPRCKAAQRWWEYLRLLPEMTPIPCFSPLPCLHAPVSLHPAHLDLH